MRHGAVVLLKDSRQRLLLKRRQENRFLEADNIYITFEKNPVSGNEISIQRFGE